MKKDEKEKTQITYAPPVVAKDVRSVIGPSAKQPHAVRSRGDVNALIRIPTKPTWKRNLRGQEAYIS